MPAAGVNLIYDTLMAQSPDEESTEYGLVAEWVSYPPDFSSATFGLRPEARFHDGKPITPEDVIFSLEALKKAHPHYARYYKNVVKAEKTGEHEVTFTFDMAGNRELPNILGQLYVLPKHYWEAKGANGEPRDLVQVVARGASRLRALQDQGILGGQQHRLRAGQGLLGEGSAGRGRAVELRRDAVPVFSRSGSRLRGVQERQF